MEGYIKTDLVLRFLESLKNHSEKVRDKRQLEGDDHESETFDARSEAYRIAYDWFGGFDEKDLEAAIKDFDGEAERMADWIQEEMKPKNTCFNCRKKMYQNQTFTWYHGDQDDQVCETCAKALTHTDTIYAGMNVYRSMT